jgi:type IV secretory pathway VirB2 component (pilin)
VPATRQAPFAQKENGMKLKHPIVAAVLLLAVAIVLLVVPVSAQCVGADCPPPAPETPPVTPPVRDADIYQAFASFAVLVQALVQPLKKLWQDKKDQATFDLLAALFFSELLCLTFRVNVFAAAGLKATTEWAAWICIFLTGYLMSVGANQVHNLISKNQPAPALTGGK